MSSKRLWAWPIRMILMVVTIAAIVVRAVVFIGVEPSTKQARRVKSRVRTRVLDSADVRDV